MKSGFLASLLICGSAARPSMDRVLRDVQNLNYTNEPSSELLYGLIDATQVGRDVKSILTGSAPATEKQYSQYLPPGALDSALCKKDKCCIWSYIVKELTKEFSGCNRLSRGAVRQGFHDAAAWDVKSSFGGADGSLLLTDELERSDNKGLKPIGSWTKMSYQKWKGYGVSMADFIQISALVGTITCPGGPRIRAFVGRQDDTRAAPMGKLPFFFQDAVTLIAMFEAKTFTAADLIALMGAHTISRQKFVDPARADAPQDTTPATWDNKYYAETVISDNKTVLVLPSDRDLATHSQTSGLWDQFSGVNGREIWSPRYARAYVRMSLLGVRNINDLVECTHVLPPAIAI